MIMTNATTEYVELYQTAMSQGNVTAAQTYAQLAVETLIDTQFLATRVEVTIVSAA